jgi:hypothetical protein
MKNSISVEKIHGADWIQPYHLIAGSKEISHQDCLCISSLEENHIADEKKNSWMQLVDAAVLLFLITRAVLKW